MTPLNAPPPKNDHTRSMRSFWVGLGISLAATCLLAPSPAHAGCLQVCTLTVDQPEITPELACVSIEAKPQTCDCSIFLEVSNACASAISLPFADGFCDATSELEGRCIVQPGEQGAAKLRLRELGEKTFDIELIDSDDNKHLIHATAHVTSLDDGCYCTVPGGGGRLASTRGLVIAAALLGALAARRGALRGGRSPKSRPGAGFARWRGQVVVRVVER